MAPSQTWGSLRKTAEDASKPLPADWYDVTVSKSEATVASTGSPMIKATLDVTSGPQAGNRKVWTQFVFKPDSPFALQMFFKNLGAFGLDDKFFDGLPDDQNASMGIIASSLVGTSARAKIGPRAYQGVERDNVEEIAPMHGGPQRPAASVAPAPGGAAQPPTPQAGPPVPQQTPPTPSLPTTSPAAAPPPPVF